MIATYTIQDFFETPIKLEHFHINKLEEMPLLPKSIISPHKHKFVEIFLLTNGSMEHNIDFNEFVIKKNNLFFISEGQYHFWSKTNRINLSGYRLMFEESFIQNVFSHQNFLFELVFLNNVYQNPLMSFSLKHTYRLVQLFELLYDEYCREDFNIRALQANLYLLLLEVQRETKPNKIELDSRYHLEIYQKFNLLVNNHYTENKTNIWYAKQLNISQVQLNKIVSKFSNNAIGQFVQNRKILEAKRLITITSKTIKEIAYDIGFDDYSYFIRVFKKNLKVTPQEFRSGI